MKLATLAALALFAAGSVATASTFANFSYVISSPAQPPLQWGGCTTSCTEQINFTFDPSIKNFSEYNGWHVGSLTYDWQGVAGTLVTGPGTAYQEDVTGTFAFSYTPPGGTDTNMLTVDFSTAHGQLYYYRGQLYLSVDTISTATPPGMTSDVVQIPGTLTDWSFVIDFGNVNPGYGSGKINDFLGSNFSGYIASVPTPGGQVPEPASMLIAGAGLLAVGGLLRLRKRAGK